MKHIICAGILALTLSSCSIFSPKPPPAPPQPEYVAIKPDPIRQVTLPTVEWQAWNHARIVEEAANADNADVVYFVLTQEELGKLFTGINTATDLLWKFHARDEYWLKRYEAYQEEMKTYREKVK